MELGKRSYTTPIMTAFTVGFLASTALFWDTAKTRVENQFLKYQNSELRGIVYTLKSENDLLTGFTLGRIYEGLESEMGSPRNDGKFFREVNPFPDIKLASDRALEGSKATNTTRSLFDYPINLK